MPEHPSALLPPAGSLAFSSHSATRRPATGRQIAGSRIAARPPHGMVETWLLPHVPGVNHEQLSNCLQRFRRLQAVSGHVLRRSPGKYDVVIAGPTCGRRVYPQRRLHTAATHEDRALSRGKTKTRSRASQEPRPRGRSGPSPAATSAGSWMKSARAVSRSAPELLSAGTSDSEPRRAVRPGRRVANSDTDS